MRECSPDLPGPGDFPAERVITFELIDVLVSRIRNIAGGTVLHHAFVGASPPAAVITDRATALANVIENLIPTALGNTWQRDYHRCESNRCESNRGRLAARLRPLRGLLTDPGRDGGDGPHRRWH